MVQHACSPSKILRSSIPVRDVGAKYIPRLGPPPTLSAGASAAAGAPGGMQGVSPSEESGRTVPPAAQYDLITDLLDANMFKVYVDMLKSDKQRVKTGQPAKFGYLPMMVVATLGVVNAESFCERVLSCQ